MMPQKSKLSNGVSSQDRICLAKQIKDTIKGRSIGVVGIDYGGRTQFDNLSPYLRKNGVEFQYSGTLLLHYGPQGDEHRSLLLEFNDPFSEVFSKDVLLLFDDWSERGKSWIGALKYALLNREKYNFKEVFVGVNKDSTGGTQFAAIRTVPYRITEHFLHKSAPSTYEELRELDLLKFIGSVDSQIANRGLIIEKRLPEYTDNMSYLVGVLQ